MRRAIVPRERQRHKNGEAKFKRCCKMCSTVVLCIYYIYVSNYCQERTSKETSKTRFLTWVLNSIVNHHISLCRIKAGPVRLKKRSMTRPSKMTRGCFRLMLSSAPAQLKGSIESVLLGRLVRRV